MYGGWETISPHRRSEARFRCQFYTKDLFLLVLGLASNATPLHLPPNTSVFLQDYQPIALSLRIYPPFSREVNRERVVAKNKVQSSMKTSKALGLSTLLKRK